MMDLYIDTCIYIYITYMLITSSICTIHGFYLRLTILRKTQGTENSRNILVVPTQFILYVLVKMVLAEISSSFESERSTTRDGVVPTVIENKA
jgi:hypothetical protein